MGVGGGLKEMSGRDRSIPDAAQALHSRQGAPIVMKPLDLDCWSERRIELRAWFNRNAPSLGELYEGAVEMVFRDRFPGRVRFVAHAVREIRNRLPDVIAGPITGSQLQYRNRIDIIVDLWKKHGLPLDDVLPTEMTYWESVRATHLIPLPGEVHKEVVRLLRDHMSTRQKPEEAARRLFQAIDPNNAKAEATIRPRISQWLKATDWFVERAHDRWAIDVEMGDDELQSRFEDFEYCLSGMLREFFKTVEDLDEILEEANS